MSAANGDRSQVWMGNPALPGEFRRSLDNRTHNHLAWMYERGIDFTARDRAGGVGVANITPAGSTFLFDPRGFSALIVAVWQPWPPCFEYPRADHWISDLVAFRLQSPFESWLRIGHENPTILAPNLYTDALETGMPVRLYDTVADWLWGGCDGPAFIAAADEYEVAA